jgi:hypothetical protein
MLNFTIASDYKPGHIPQYYGTGITSLATLDDDKYQVEFTVNGEWDFELFSENKEAPCRGRYGNDPSKLTPELETVVSTYVDGDTFTHNGYTYRLTVHYNNWFEVFFYEKNTQGGWEDLMVSEIVEEPLGPEPDYLRTFLAAEFEREFGP